MGMCRDFLTSPKTTFYVNSLFAQKPADFDSESQRSSAPEPTRVLAKSCQLLVSRVRRWEAGAGRHGSSCPMARCTAGSPSARPPRSLARSDLPPPSWPRQLNCSTGHIPAATPCRPCLPRKRDHRAVVSALCGWQPAGSIGRVTVVGFAATVEFHRSTVESLVQLHFSTTLAAPPSCSGVKLCLSSSVLAPWVSQA